MPVSRPRKEELLESYVALLGKCQGIVLIENKGLSVAALTDLRRKVRASQNSCHIAKNTLTRKALGAVGLAVPEKALLQGPTIVGVAQNDLPALTKVILDFAKSNDKVVVKGGVLGTRALTARDMESLASLPPLPVIRGQLLGLISTPASRLAGVVASGVRQVVNVVKAHSEQEPAPAP